MTKTSIGIILCRINENNGRAEAAMVLRRYTYAFVEFVHGRYSRANHTRHTKNLIALFEQMTTSELLDIWSLDFNKMWFRVWLLTPQPDLFHKKLAKFQSVFMKEDGGRGLRRLLSQVSGRGGLWWEFPKGKRQTERESDLNCAIRELHEETGIEKRDYQVLPEIKRRVTFTIQGVRYIHVFYMAVALPRLSGAPVEGTNRRLTICLKDINQVGEIADVRWMDIEQIRLIDVNRRLEAIVKPVFKIAKRVRKGQFVQGPAASMPPAVSRALKASRVPKTPRVFVPFAASAASISPGVFVPSAASESKKPADREEPEADLEIPSEKEGVDSS